MRNALRCAYTIQKGMNRMDETTWQEVACRIIGGYDNEEIKEEYDVIDAQIERIRQEITDEWNKLKRVT